MCCGKSCFVPDHVNRTLKVLKHVRIPEPDNAITQFLQFVCSPLIIEKFPWLIVLPTIKFDNQLAIVTGKINDICSNRNLAAKMATLIFEKPKLLPK